MRSGLLALMLLLAPSLAHAGWYRVANYVGYIGSYPVHLSLQDYASFGSGLNVEGSYYYDAHLAPIPLYGKRIGERIELCEIHSAQAYQRVLSMGSRKGFDTHACPLQLVVENGAIRGRWRDARHSYSVKLRQVGKLDDTGAGRVSGRVDIPFWGQTRHHAFIGVYRNGKNGITIDSIRVVDKRTRSVIQQFDPQQHNCAFGFFMTPIYMNLESATGAAGKGRRIGLNCNAPHGGSWVEYRFDAKSKRFIWADD
ncbi:MAG: hypothetical protein P8011_01240 [Acidihalobacter sp.]|uniref:hypothetical protein n=1 Tax=Acidihalobacter sp. TaxID=1872108 RepID=UPI00307F3665